MTDPPAAVASPSRRRIARWYASLFSRGRPSPRPAYWWVWGCAALAALAVIAANSLILLQFRQAALDGTQSDVVKLGRVYAEATDRTLQSVDLIVSALSSVLAPLAERGKEAFRDAVTSRATGDLVAAKRGALPQLAALAVIDAEGRVLIATGGRPAIPLDVADRDYFIALRDHPELDRFISAPEQNLVTGDWSVFLAHRLRGADGAFGGLVAGAIRVDYLEDFYRAAEQDEDGAVSLWRDDGTLLVRYPASPGAVQATAAEHASFADLTATRQARVGRGAVGANALPAIVAARPLRNYPLAVTVSVTEATALNLWRREARVIGGAAVAGIVVIGLVAGLVRRHLTAKEQVAAARSEIDLETLARVQLEQAIARAEEAISEHERAEIALRESERRFRDVAEVGADVIWESGPDHRFTFFSGGSSSEIEGRLGIDVERVIGKTRWELAGVDPESSAVWRDHKAELDAHRPFRQFHYAATRENGTRVYFVVSGKPVFDRSGRFAGYRGTGTNETAIIEAHSRAERAEALLRDAVESISEGFVIYDRDDRLALCNQAFLDLYPSNRDILVPGARFEDILRDGLKRRLYADAIGREEAWFKERMETHLHPPGPVEARHSNGRWLLICERPMRRGGIAGLRIDISALKSVQEALRESEERLNRAQHQARMGSDTRDLRSGQMEWSDETYRIFGVTREDFIPTAASLLTLVHPDDRQSVVNSRAALDRGEEAPPFEYRVIRPDNSIRHVYRESELMRDEAGEPIMVAGTVRDITDLRASQARQKELERQLQHSTKMKALGTLAGGIAHDLNNTLVPILSLSKLVAERMPPGGVDREDLETITFASERTRDLLQQLLDFSRNQVSVKEGVDLAKVTQKVLQMIRVAAPATVRIVEEVEAVPRIQGDGGQLERVLVNLVTNSIQAIGRQPGIVTVTVAPATAADWADDPARRGGVALSVADTGCGMDPRTVDRIFEPFYTTKRVGEGTGLGLSVVHGIITDHGGRIEVSTKRRKGTVFKIVLPVSGGEVEPMAALVPAAYRHDDVAATPA